MSKTNTSPFYTFMPMAVYFDEITARLAGTTANDRVLLSTMSFDPRVPEVLRIVDAASRAASQGAHVAFAYDAQSYMLDPVSRNLRKAYLSNQPERFTNGLYAKVRQVRQQLAQAGVHTHITNTATTPISSPYHGRSHIKCCIFNDDVYLGGCNLSPADTLDSMVRFTDKKAAQWLYDTLNYAYAHGNVRKALNSTDQTYAINSSTSLLIDAGKPKQSSIYAAALEIIDTTQQSLTMTCQFFPAGQTAQHLAAACERGVDVSLFYNNPSKQGKQPYRGIHTFLTNRAKKRLHTMLFQHELPLEKPYLHAKILMSENAALFGSHNYVEQGVNYGTAEIAIRSTDLQFLSALNTFTEQLLR